MKNLPPNNDEFWEEGEKIPAENRLIELCGHTKANWLEYENYAQDGGSIVCNDCGWGTKVPGYMKVKNGKIVDLRNV